MMRQLDPLELAIRMGRSFYVSSIHAPFMTFLHSTLCTFARGLGFKSVWMSARRFKL